MKSLRGGILTALVFLAFVAFIAWMIYLDTIPPEQPTTRISVIAYSGDNSERWWSLDQGVQQACSELGIERPVISVLRRSGSLQLEDLLRREVENGSDGVLLAAGDQTVRPALDALPASLPVILLEDAIDDSLPCISADDAGMGRALSEYAAQAVPGGAPAHIAVLKAGMEQWSTARRYEAFVAGMEALGQPVTVLEYDETDGDLTTYLASTIATYRPDIQVLAVLDNDSLEVAIDATPAAMTDVRLWGIGNSDKVVHALDTGPVDALVYQNEYAVGYIGTMELAGAIGIARPPGSTDIQYRLVTKQTMYEPELERLLFPIIQ